MDSILEKFVRLVLSTLAVAGLALAVDPAALLTDQPLRFGISERVLRGVNLADAKSILSVWSEEIGKASGTRMLLDQNSLMSQEQILDAIRTARIDLFLITIQEYRSVAKYVDNKSIVMDRDGGEELVLVVREDSGITDLAGLKGRLLVVHNSAIAAIAEPWLAILTWRTAESSPEQFFRSIARNTKVSQAVLPVFFGQADACVVTRSGLESMFELNPQVARKLRVIESFPKAVGAVFACKRDLKGKSPVFFENLMKLQFSPAARQGLMLFQSRGFSVRSSDFLQSSVSLLEEYERIYEHGTKTK